MNNYQMKRVKGCLKREEQLSAWEIDFLESLADRPEDYILSPKQNHTLNEIAYKVKG